jgi:uncharacterized membrane protein YqjE
MARADEQMTPVGDEAASGARAESTVNRDKPAGDLVKDLSEQVSTLVRREFELARLEMQEKGKRAGMGAGLFGGAGVMALYGGAALLTAIVLLIATSLEPWIAALIVAVALFLIAGVLALSGKKQVEQATPAAPEAAIESTKRDVDEVKARAKRA